jgi:hypothetical protein
MTTPPSMPSGPTPPILTTSVLTVLAPLRLTPPLELVMETPPTPALSMTQPTKLPLELELDKSCGEIADSTGIKSVLVFGITRNSV